MVQENIGPVGPDERAFVELRRLNGQVLSLMRAQALSGPDPFARPVFVVLRDLWARLTAESISRAASACPCLLVDFGFLDARRWIAVANDVVHDQERMPLFFDVPATPVVARAVLAEAWHYARARGSLLGLFGIPGRVAQIIERCTQMQVLALAERHGGWLQPRWATRLWFWEGLLTAALSGNETALRRCGAQAVTLLAAEMKPGGRL